MARTFYAIEAGDVRMISNGYTFSAGTKGAFDAVSATWTPAQRAAYDEAVTQLNRWIAERDVLPAPARPPRAPVERWGRPRFSTK